MFVIRLKSTDFKAEQQAMKSDDDRRSYITYLIIRCREEKDNVNSSYPPPIRTFLISPTLVFVPVFSYMDDM